MKQRIYYRQGKLAYTAEEGIEYDDTYKIPLYDLMSKNDVRSMPALQMLLDDNGYIGRSSVRRVYNHNCCPLNEVRIRVGLIWSGLNYTWPINGVWSLDYARVLVDDKCVIIPDGTKRAVKELYRFLAVDPYTITRGTGMKFKDAKELVSYFTRMGIICNGKLKVVDDKELEEVIANILTQQN